MTYMRHSSRMAKQTIFQYLKSQLDALEWTNATAASRPFQAAQVELHDTVPAESEQRAKLVAGYVALSMGSEPALVEQEMGGPLGLTQIPVAVDLLMDSQGAAHALACDIRDIFLGCFTNSSRSIVVNDYTTNAAGVPNNDYVVEFDQVLMSPSNDVENWWTVRLVASLYAPQVVS